MGADHLCAQVTGCSRPMADGRFYAVCGGVAAEGDLQILDLVFRLRSLATKGALTDYRYNFQSIVICAFAVAGFHAKGERQRSLLAQKRFLLQDSSVQQGFEQSAAAGLHHSVLQQVFAFLKAGHLVGAFGVKFHQMPHAAHLNGGHGYRAWR